MILDLDRTPPGRSLLPIQGDLALDFGAGGPATVAIAGHLEVDNLDRRFLVRGNLEACGEAECGRCLKEFPLTFSVPVEIVVLRSAVAAASEEEGEGDNLVIHQLGGEVDLREALRESVVLAVPQVKICTPDCRGLCPNCGVDWNQESCDCAAADHDPRWDGLPEV